MRKAFLIIMALAALAVGGCGRGLHNTDSDSLPKQDYTDAGAAWADSVLSTMTLEQKAGMLFMPAIFTSADPMTLRLVDEYADSLGVGGIILLKGDTTSAIAITQRLHASGHRDMFVAIDAEWGLGMRLMDAPSYPVFGKLGQEATEEQMYDYGADVAAQSRRLGINMVLGPVLDVTPEGGFSYIGPRSLGSDKQKVARLGVAYSHGLEGGGVMSVAKHFPGQGSLMGDSHKTLPVLDGSLHRLDSIDLEPFREYISEGLSGVLVGHMVVSAVDYEIRSATMSPSVMIDLLRGDLGFKGLVITDALNMKGAGGGRASEAVKAGADMIIAPTSTKRSIADVVEAVKKGELDEELLNDRCRRILFYKYRFSY